MNLQFLAFSEQGMALARRLSDALGGSCTRCGGDMTLQNWTADRFRSADGLIFVGAAGIAVRAIAPFVESKLTDPAVVAVDECGTFAVPLLSGHLGGANDLARRISAVCGAVPVITTATDRNGVFSVDAWARVQGCRLVHPEKIKELSARLLAGKTVAWYSDFKIAGTVPDGLRETGREDADLWLSVFTGENALCAVPPAAVLGIGCKKGTPRQAIEECFADMVSETHISPLAFCRAASVDLKAREPGLLEFCAAHGLELETFSPSELQALPGQFTASDFVRQTAGTDNVCERSAAASAKGTLLIRKRKGRGVTMAAACIPFYPDWRWRNG